MTTEPTPRIVVTVAASPDVVWKALRDKEKIRHWHGWEYDALDAEIEQIYFTDFTEDSETRTLDVQGGDLIVVEPHPGGSRVTLTRAPHGTDPEWDAYYDDVTEGWVTFLQQLRFALERHPDEPRRTVFVAGTGRVPPFDELGIADVAAIAVGDSYRAELLGEQVSGSVWFRSDHQCGLTVEGWGDGLLVVSHLRPGDSKPDGATMAVLTLYGLDEARYDAVDQRWQSWWSAHLPMPQPAETP